MGFLVDLPYPNVEGDFPIPRMPMNFSTIENNIRRRAPTLGEHTDSILQSLGYRRRRNWRATSSPSCVMEADISIVRDYFVDFQSEIVNTLEQLDGGAMFSLERIETPKRRIFAASCSSRRKDLRKSSSSVHLQPRHTASTCRKRNTAAPFRKELRSNSNFSDCAPLESQHTYYSLKPADVCRGYESESLVFRGRIRFDSIFAARGGLS